MSLFKESSPDGNQIIINTNNSKIENSTITFYGENNILFIEDGVTLSNSTIIFYGSHGLLYICHSRHNVTGTIDVNQNCTVFLGSNNYIRDSINILAAERQNVLIGNDGFYSFNILIRTSDSHPIYSAQSHERINYSRSVLIGDHVWLGQDVHVFKGCQIGSGSIIGGGAVLAGKTVPSNQSWGGNPAKCLKRDIFFTGGCVNGWTEEQSQLKSRYEADDFIYRLPNSSIKNLTEIDHSLKNCFSVLDRLEYIKNNLANPEDKNRFYIS